jgi:hypothetical protein
MFIGALDFFPKLVYFATCLGGMFDYIMKGNDSAFSHQLRIHLEAFFHTFVRMVAVYEKKIDTLILEDLVYFLKGLPLVRVCPKQVNLLAIPCKLPVQRTPIMMIAASEPPPWQIDAHKLRPWTCYA